METRMLGVTGRQVGAIGLGCMGMSFAYSASRRDDSESIRVIHTALDVGATLIDTADVYGPFTNEELVGKALRGRRDRATLASKVGLVIDDDGDIVPNGDPDHIRRGAEAALRRLGTDRLELYQLHRVDPLVPLEDSWSAMAELVSRGLVGAIGMSEVTVEQLDLASAIHPVATVQTELSLWSAEQLQSVVPWCAANGAAFIAYSPLGRGYLTGSVSSIDELEDNDWRRSNPRFTAEAIAANQQLIKRISEIADGYDATPAQISLAWYLPKPHTSSRYPGRSEKSTFAKTWRQSS